MGQLILSAWDHSGIKPQCIWPKPEINSQSKMQLSLSVQNSNRWLVSKWIRAYSMIKQFPSQLPPKLIITCKWMALKLTLKSCKRMISLILRPHSTPDLPWASIFFLWIFNLTSLKLYLLLQELGSPPVKSLLIMVQPVKISATLPAHRHSLL